MKAALGADVTHTSKATCSHLLSKSRALGDELVCGMAGRERSPSPARKAGVLWAMHRYRSHKSALGDNGARLVSRELLRATDRALWQAECKQKSPSGLFTSILICTEAKCYQHLENVAKLGARASSSASNPGSVPGQHHDEIARYANCLLYKLCQGWDNVANVFESYCDELDDLHRYCIQRVVWLQVLEDMLDTDVQFITGERDAAVDCAQKNVARIQACIDWCKNMLMDLKLR